MSRENTVHFLKAVEADSELKERLRKAEAKADAWITIAQEADFEFTADDLKVVSELLTDRELTADNCAEALHEYIYQLSDEELDRVAGGLDPAAFTFGRRLARISVGPGFGNRMDRDRGPDVGPKHGSLEDRIRERGPLRGR